MFSALAPSDMNLLQEEPASLVGTNSNQQLATIVDTQPPQNPSAGDKSNAKKKSKKSSSKVRNPLKYKLGEYPLWLCLTVGVVLGVIIIAVAVSLLISTEEPQTKIKSFEDSRNSRHQLDILIT